MDRKQLFYQHFTRGEAALQSEIDSLASITSGPSARQEVTDRILTGIAKLQNEVADAAEYTPAYDRKQYSESLKALQDRLNKAVAKSTPANSRFRFKRTAKTAHADAGGGGAPGNDPRLHPGSLPHEQQFKTSAPTSKADAEPERPSSSPPAPEKDYNAEMSSRSQNGSSLRRPSFSAASQLAITGQTRLHIVLPASATHATAAGSVTKVHNCVVDMSVPTGSEGTPFPGLVLRDINRSVIIVGRVGGAMHMTGVQDSIIVAASRQVRIHECHNVDLYLHCASHPIIEDCSGLRFTTLPKSYMTSAEEAVENQWDQVDDFKWLKAGHSPNWSVLPEAERLDDSIWTEVVTGKSNVDVNVDQMLAQVGLGSK